MVRAEGNVEVTQVRLRPAFAKATAWQAPQSRGYGVAGELREALSLDIE
jgi:hypothetical protein